MKRGTPLRIPEGILNWRASKETHGELGGTAVPEVLRWEQRRMENSDGKDICEGA